MGQGWWCHKKTAARSIRTRPVRLLGSVPIRSAVIRTKGALGFTLCMTYGHVWSPCIRTNQIGAFARSPPYSHPLSL